MLKLINNVFIFINNVCSYYHKIFINKNDNNKKRGPSKTFVIKIKNYFNKMEILSDEY